MKFHLHLDRERRFIIIFGKKYDACAEFSRRSSRISRLRRFFFILFFFHKSSVVKVSASNFEVLSRAVSRLDLSHQLIFSRNITFSFPRGAGYPTYWVFINVKCRRHCLMRGTFFRFGRSPPSARKSRFGSLRSPDLSRYVRWSLAGFAIYPSCRPKSVYWLVG